MKARAVHSVVAAVGLFTSIAGAATITKTYTSEMHDATWEEIAKIDKFDTSKGTLTQVDVYCWSYIYSAMSLTVNVPGTVAYSGSLKERHKVDALVFPAYAEDYVIKNSGNVTKTWTLDGFKGYGDLGWSDVVPENSMEHDQSFTGSADLQSFSGSGQVQFTLVGHVIIELLQDWTPFPPNMTTTYFDRAIESQAGVEVTYTYTPVPEPAALGLAAIGGLALLRRRR